MNVAKTYKLANVMAACPVSAQFNIMKGRINSTPKPSISES
jgi:hypothetical protein